MSEEMRDTATQYDRDTLTIAPLVALAVGVWIMVAPL